MISKSNYMTWLSCPSLLWHSKHRPDLLPQEEDPTAEARMNEGQQVEALARKLFPEGVVIDHEQSFNDVASATQDAVESAVTGQPICQGVSTAHDLVCEVDILVPVDGGWELFEVKASNGLKQEFIPDVAFQRHVLEKAGIPVAKAHVIHLNREYVRQGDIVPEDLFIIEDVTAETDELLPEIASDIEEIRQLLASDKPPGIDLDEDAIDPRDYPKLFPDVASVDHSVFDLYRGGRKARALYADGIASSTDIPDGYSLTDRQTIQIACERSGEAHLDGDAVGEFLDGLVYPLYLLDFETMNSAIPIVDGTSPYQQVPFQFSLHSCRSLDEESAHHGWIWNPDKEGDPRLELLRRLEDSVGSRGSIIVFNQAFEKMILRQAVEAFPEFKGFVENVLDRIVDLLVPFRSFAAYHPDQQGSCSIKYVLPAWCGGDGYDGMAISNGGMAATEYVRVMFGNDGEDKEQVLGALDAYCCQDTMAMLELMRVLAAASTLS